MRAAIASDLHLGTSTGADVAREGKPLERLVDAVAGADTIVLLGDVLELREGPLAAAVDAGRPLFERLGAAAAGKRVVLVPGNHDYELVEPWLAQARLEGRPLAPAAEWRVGPEDGPAGRIAAWMPEVELVMAYPGTWARDDVYVIHGHYVDVHMTVPRFESLAAALVARAAGHGRHCRSPDQYEAVQGPLYALMFRLAQTTASEALRRRGGFSRRVWSSLNGADTNRLARFALGRVTIPGAVALLNRAGLGPFDSDLSGEALRAGGVRAMGTVVDGLEVDPAHVVFGHTHRPGPLPRDEPGEWRSPRGVRLWNSGSWLMESVLIGDSGPGHPYWPGTVVLVPEEGDPVIRNVLRDVAVPFRVA